MVYTAGVRPVSKCVSGVFLPFFHELIEVFFHILKDKVEVVILSDDFSQSHHVGMAQLLQRLKTQSI